MVEPVSACSSSDNAHVPVSGNSYPALVVWNTPHGVSCDDRIEVSFDEDEHD
jgi:hypothetical protein